MQLRSVVSAAAALLLLLLLAHADARSIDNNAVDEESGRAAGGGEASSFLGDLRAAFREYSECSGADLSSCLKLKLVASLERAARSAADLSLADGVALVPDPAATAAEAQRGEPKTEQQLAQELPRALADREQSLDAMIAERIFGLLRTHTLQLRLPSADEFRSLTEEGRGKNKKMGGLLMLPLMMGGMMIPLALGGLALLAGKALLVSKLALVLAGIIGLKKLLSHQGGGHESSYQVVSVPSHGHHGRSFQAAPADIAQEMAYRAYAPAAPALPAYASAQAQ